TTTTSPPLTRGPQISKIDKSKLNDVVASTRLISSSPNSRTTHSRNATPFPCSTTTPFGCPVEPDVYSTYATFPAPTSRFSSPSSSSISPHSPSISITSTPS